MIILNELEPVLHLENTTENFTIRGTKSDKNNSTHIRLQQNYKGVPVHGGEVVVHLNSFGEGEAFNGRYIVPAADIDIVPSVEMQAAIGKVKADVSKGIFRKATYYFGETAGSVPGTGSDALYL